MVLRLILSLVILVSAFNTYAYERVVILAPAAADIFQRLDAKARVVGVTRNIEEFSSAVKVGTHIRPNVEIIRSLNPDLIISGSADSYYGEAIQSITGADVYKYDPRSLDEILKAIAEIATMIDKNKEAELLIKELQSKLATASPLSIKPRVVFEVSQLPFTVAGQGNIVAAIVKAAGAELIENSSDKLVKLSIERVVASRPDVYIWQTGPMNTNPVPPSERPEFKRLKSNWIHVDEKKFSRANSMTFDAVIELNSTLRKIYE